MKGYLPDPKLKLDLIGDEISVPAIMFASAPPMPNISMNTSSSSLASISSNTVSSSSSSSSGGSSHKMNHRITSTGSVRDCIGVKTNRKHGRTGDKEEGEMKNNGMTSYAGYSRKKQCTKPNDIKKY